MKSPFQSLVSPRNQRRRAARDEHRRTALGVEPLEIRRAFATYEIESILHGSASVDGWSVFGMASNDNLTITTTNTSTRFTTGVHNLTVHFGSQGLQRANVHNVTDHTVTLTLPALSAITWNGTSNTTYANVTFSDAGANGSPNTSNNAFIAYPANIASISNIPLTVNASANFTLVATDPARGFGNLTNHSFFLFGPNGSVSDSLAGSVTNSTDSTNLTVHVPPGVMNMPGNYTLQTTPSGAAPANATDSANIALIGNLSVSVESINYTIASITYQNQAISGWSYLGSGNDTINITLANGSTPFPSNTTVFFTDSSNATLATVTNLTPSNGSMTLSLPVPYWGSYAGSPTNTTLSFGQSPNNDTTNGTFLYHSVNLTSNLNQAYLAGGGNLTLTANSAAYGFNTSQNLTVTFKGLNSTVDSVSAPPTNSTSLTVVVPKFADTGDYSIFIGSPVNTSIPASNNLSFTVMANPVIDNLTITFQNNTNLTANTVPAINDLYLYVFGTLNNKKGFFDINATNGQVGQSAHFPPSNGSAPQNGVAFTSLNNSTMFFNLTGGAYNGTRVYFSTENNLTNQPTAGFATSYYDFIELSASNAAIYADTSQVDEFGMPFTINLTLNGNGQILTQAPLAGISDGLTRQDIITGYNTAFANVPGYNLAIVPLDGLGNENPPTYRVLAPNDLLNAITAEASAFQQPESQNFTITPQNGTFTGTHGNYSHWAYLNITAGGNLNGTLYPEGSPVSGPFIPAGTVIAETNSAGNATSFKIATNQTIANATPFLNANITGSMALNVGGVMLQNVSSNMTSAGYQALTNAFGPSVYNFAANGSPVAWSNVTLNQNNAIDLMFNRYKSTPGGQGYFWWQEENQPDDVILGNNAAYPLGVALYRGEVMTAVNITNIENGLSNYTVLRFIDYTNGTANPTLTTDIYYPYFTTNSPAGKVDPFGNPVPAPPSWFTQAQGNFKTPSLQVFGGSGIFQPGGNSTGGPFLALNDLGRDVAVALSRGYSATMLSTGEPINNASNPNLPVFAFTDVLNTTGNWTMPTSVYNAANPASAVNITGWVAASMLNFDSPMTITSVSTVGPNTVIDVKSFVSGAAIIIKPGAFHDNLQFVNFADNSSMYPNGAGSIPYNMYESFIQSRGDFAAGVSDGSGSEKVNINGLGYGYAFSDYMGLSSTITVGVVTTAQAPRSQSASLIVTMQPWFNDAPVVVTYDIDSVTFESQVITGWSLFGSGTDQVTVSTTASSTPFNQNATYNLAFGGLNATGTATGNNTLTISVPSLTSLWTGVGESDFANLSFLTANSTTGNTSFSVLPVNLANVAANNGPLAGSAANLTAVDKQHGFGNATNLSVFFSRSGVTDAATNVTVFNATTLTLTTAAVGEPGNWTLGVYKDAGATASNLASNNLTYLYNDAPVVVNYDIASVTFESRVITGWSLFGSGTDQVTVSTTANSTPFNLSATYNLAFGGLNATGTATANNTLNISVPSLTSLWTGGSDFANLSFLTANSTTGNTSFSVLPVNLANVAANNGPLAGSAANLTAVDKQHGFGNATNLSVFFSRSGVTDAATNVTVLNATTLTLTTAAVGEPGNWTLGVYKDAGATASNLASNNLTYLYTEASQVFLSGDFNADGLTDIAMLLDDGNWQVSFTQSGGNASIVSLNSSNHWTTNVTWADWSVLRSGDRDMIVARAEVPNESGSWWKLSYDGVANGTSATDFSTNFVGSWYFSEGVQWLDVVNGDFDGDGNADIIGRDSVNNQWWMLANATQTATTSTFAAKNVYLGAWSSDEQWDQTLAGNFRGDPVGKAQVAGLTGSTWWISEYGGTPGSMNHTLMTTQWNRQENFTDYLVGNFDGVPNGRDLIAAKTETNAWYSIGSNTSITPQNNTPSLMGIWPDHTSTYSDVLVGDFMGSGNGTVGIAGLRRSNGNLSWSVLERGQNGGDYSVQNFGSWPQSTLAQAFAGLYSAGDVSSGRTGVLGRTQQGVMQAWDRGISNGTAFAVGPVTGYPSS